MWLKTLNARLFFSFELNFLDKNSLVFDNQLWYSACPKDKWIGKFFSYSFDYVMLFIVGFGEIP